jgi:hypothetical protein
VLLWLHELRTGVHVDRGRVTSSSRAPQENERSEPPSTPQPQETKQDSTHSTRPFPRCPAGRRSRRRRGKESEAEGEESALPSPRPGPAHVPLDASRPAAGAGEPVPSASPVRARISGGSASDAPHVSCSLLRGPVLQVSLPVSVPLAWCMVFS